MDPEPEQFLAPLPLPDDKIVARVICMRSQHDMCSRITIKPAPNHPDEEIVIRAPTKIVYSSSTPSMNEYWQARMGGTDWNPKKPDDPKTEDNQSLHSLSTD